MGLTLGCAGRSAVAGALGVLEAEALGTFAVADTLTLGVGVPVPLWLAEGVALALGQPVGVAVAVWLGVGPGVAVVVCDGQPDGLAEAELLGNGSVAVGVFSFGFGVWVVSGAVGEFDGLGLAEEVGRCEGCGTDGFSGSTGGNVRGWSLGADTDSLGLMLVGKAGVPGAVGFCP